MNWLVIAGLARHLVSGGGLVAMAEGFKSGHDVIAVAGAVGTIAGFAWSALAPEKKK